MAAIGASSASRKCVLVTDGPLGRSNSMMAQGGMQLPFPTRESEESFYQDIVRSARVALDATLVRNFVAHVRETIERLEEWGLELDRDGNGEIVRRLAGGLSEPRIVSVRDQIGPAIMKLLRTRLRACYVEIIDHTRVVGLRSRSGHLLLELEKRDGGRAEIAAKAVICCTGGLTYREARRRKHPTTNPPNDNHVMFDVLARLGLEQVHADYYQYQPFGIVTAEREEVGKCVPESIVNFGVRLLDRHGVEIGNIREDRYSLTQRMFALAKEGRAERVNGGTPGLWLTLGDVDPERLSRVFPKLWQIIERRGQVGENILVYPFLHYHLGGLKIGPRCETSLPGLFLAGEVTGGIHGRNRLMGNGITDALVHGRLAGDSALSYAAG